MAGFTDAGAAFDSSTTGLSNSLMFNLIGTDADSQDRKIAAQDFIDPVIDTGPTDEPSAPSANANAAAAAGAGKTPNIAKAGKFAKRQLTIMRKAKVFNGSIPKKDAAAAAKYRQFNARLTPAQRAKVKKYLKGRK